MAETERIGVYGGTFDPIHNTHLAVARAALREARLDRVIFVVAATPPHKGGDVHADAESRYDMVLAAIADEPRMEASRLELDRDGFSYTVDTLEALHAAHPGAAFFLITGYDMFLDIPKWRQSKKLLSLARILTVRRPGFARPIPPALEGCYDLLPFETSDISSTSIRKQVAAGQDIAALAPPGVAAIIREKGLYHGC